MSRVVLGLAVALAVLSPGCRKKPPQEVDVAGKVEKADGKPLGNVLVRFHPQDDVNKQGRILTRPTGADGSFTGRCLPGRYRVTVSAIPKQTGGDPGTGAVGAAGKDSLPGVPASYQSPTETPWEITIPEDGKKDLVLSLK